MKAATASDVSVVISWRPEAGDPTIAHPRWQFSGDGSNLLPSRVTSGLDIVVLPRPKKQITLAVSFPGSESSVVLEPIPEVVPQTACTGSVGPYHFYGDSCGDSYQVSGNVVVISFGNGQSTTIPKNNPQYRASLGFWEAGDFNGDGLTDLVHFVVNNPGLENFVHVHFSEGNGNFDPPTARFFFPEHSSPDYNAALGHWYVRDVNGDGKDDLVHDPQLPGGRIHNWISNGDGTFTLQ